MDQSKKYISALVSVILLAVAVQFCVIKYGVAPYGIQNSAFGFDNIVVYKTDGRFVKTAKTTAIKDAYDVYMIGSSRLRDGLDPQTVTALTDQTAFNYGLSGLLVPEMERIIEHLLEHKQPKAVIVGLDFFAFNDNTKPSDEMVLEAALPLEASLKLYLSKFSLKVVKQTYQHEEKKIQVFCNTNGFCEDKRFTPTEVGYYIDQGLANMGKATHPLANFERYDESMKAFERMLDKLAENKTQALFFHSPAHVEYYTRLEEIGLRDTYEQWKKELNEKIINHGYVVWDFNIASPATTLAFDQSERYFNDDLHYTKYFGDIIVKTMINPNGTDEYAEYSHKATEKQE